MFVQVFIIALLAGMSPGPDFFIVMKNSLGYGRNAGVATSIGIASALAFHATYTILGIAVIMRHYHMLYVIIQLFGAVYLAYLGIVTLLSTFKKVGSELEKAEKQKDRKNLKDGFLNGFLCNILNPKAFVFFLSIFSQFITPSTPKWMELVYGTEVVLTIGLWFVVLSVLVSSNKFQAVYKRLKNWIERVFSVILIFFAVKVFKSAIG